MGPRRRLLCAVVRHAWRAGRARHAPALDPSARDDIFAPVRPDTRGRRSASQRGWLRPPSKRPRVTDSRMPYQYGEQSADWIAVVHREARYAPSIGICRRSVRRSRTRSSVVRYWDLLPRPEVAARRPETARPFHGEAFTETKRSM